MSSDSVNREFAIVEATEWWSFFMAELTRRRDMAARSALSYEDAVDIYRAQGTYKALNNLINMLEDPIVSENGTFQRRDKE